MSQFGKFHDFCRDSTLPVCNLFSTSEPDGDNDFDKSCRLNGFHAIRNLGSILLCAIAILVSLLLIWLSDRKKAAVGRREMQVFLVGYIIISIAEIFTVGGFLTNHDALVWFTALHLGAITATCWVLMLNAIVGYQMMDDGTLLSLGLVIISGLAFFVGTAYVSVATGVDFHHQFPFTDDTLKNIALYVLYLLLPLVLVVAFFVLESILVLGLLQETRPMVLLSISALLFAIGQIFDFVISVHLCHATGNRINGALFETLFTLLAVVALWFFWSSITEDEWPDDPMNPTLMSEPNYA